MHLGFAFVSDGGRRPSPHKQELSGAHLMVNGILSGAVAVLMFAAMALAQPPQAQRQQQAQPSTQPSSQPAQQRSSEDQQTTPEAQRAQFPGQQRQQQP